MKKQVLILVCFLVVLSGIGIVSAETLTGTLGSESMNTTAYTQAAGSGNGNPLRLHFMSIQLSGDLKSIVEFPTVKGTFDSAAPNGAITSFTARQSNISGTIVGSGTFGYARLYNSVGTEIPGYIYVVFDSWTGNTLTGDMDIYLNYSRSAVYNVTISKAAVSGHAVGTALFNDGTNWGDGSYILNKDVGIINTYTATSPSGLKITGYINKTVSDKAYSSRVYIYNASNGAAITNDATLNSVDFSFNVPQSSIIIGIINSVGTSYNSSVLFSTTTPTITPTTSPTPAPTIAPGYVRTSVETIDGTTGNTIHGSNIFLYDVEGSTWSNSSSDSDGIHYIDTLPYHTINAYATFTAFAGEYTDASALGLPTGYYGGFTYYLSMFPPALSPGEGNVNLYVTVLDADTYDILRDASVQVRLPTGAVQGGSTGSSGTEIFVVPNSTVINIAAAKAGYVGSNTVINSGAGTTASATVYLHKAVITTTPTSTIPPGGVTPAVTADPNDPSITGSTNAKGQEMLNWLAMNGMDLVQLCFLVTVMALLGIKFGK